MEYEKPVLIMLDIRQANGQEYSGVSSQRFEADYENQEESFEVDD